MTSRRIGAMTVLALACATSCTRQEPGTYFVVTSSVPFTSVEFFFGGRFTSCTTGDLAIHPPAGLTTTPAGSTHDAVGAVRVFRRQTVANGDVYDAQDPDGHAVTTYTLRLSSAADSSSTPPPLTPDTLGEAVIVVASDANGPVAVGEVDAFEVSGSGAYEYEVPLIVPATGGQEVEVWGPPGAPTECVRSTQIGSTTGNSSTYVVDEWDHDCDGFLEQCAIGSSQPAILDDCNPNAYCGTDVTGAATTGCFGTEVGTCLAAVTMAGTDGACEPGVCFNQPGSAMPACGAAGGAGGSDSYCLTGAECMPPPATCTKSVLECVALDTLPFGDCSFPVGSNGELCAGGSGSDGKSSAALIPSLNGCPQIVATVATGSGSAAVEGVTYAVAPDPLLGNGCYLIITPTTSGSDAGQLPITRLLLVYSQGSGSTESYVLEIDPLAGACVPGAQTSCSSGGAATGMTYTCGGPEPS